MPGGIGGEEEEDLLIEVNQWVVEQGLPEGEFLFELADPESRRSVRRAGPGMAGRHARGTERAGGTAAERAGRD